MMETPIVFKSAAYQLVGILHRPDRQMEAKVPAILMLHGFTGHKGESHRLFVKAARALVRAGVIVLRFDFRGSGDSGGEFEEITITGWQHDAREALTFLSQQAGVDQARIGVIGLSTGGSVACHLAAHAESPCVRSVAIWSAVADGAEVLAPKSSFEVQEHLIRHGWVDRDGNKVSADFIREFGAMQPAKDLERATCPVFIVHGGADQTVPTHQADIFEKSARSTSDRIVKKLIVPSANHTYADLVSEPRVIASTVDWFRATLTS